MQRMVINKISRNEKCKWMEEFCGFSFISLISGMQHIRPDTLELVRIGSNVLSLPFTQFNFFQISQHIYSNVCIYSNSKQFRVVYGIAVLYFDTLWNFDILK